MASSTHEFTRLANGRCDIGSTKARFAQDAAINLTDDDRALLDHKHSAFSGFFAPDTLAVIESRRAVPAARGFTISGALRNDLAAFNRKANCLRAKVTAKHPDAKVASDDRVLLGDIKQLAPGPLFPKHSADWALCRPRRVSFAPHPQIRV